jgi:hypothetical protein
MIVEFGITLFASVMMFSHFPGIYLRFLICIHNGFIRFDGFYFPGFLLVLRGSELYDDIQKGLE